MTARRYRIALIGCGDIAETGHLPALLRHPRFEVAALCDVRPQRARLLSDQAGGVPTDNDYHRSLERDVDAVILALHPEHSVDVAIDCLRRGLPVLDEKPLATSVEQGLRVAEQVRRGGVYQIGFVFRYADFVREVAQMSQQLGVPAVYHVGVYDENLDRGNHEHFQRIQQILAASSAITHEGSHVIDFFSLWNSAGLINATARAVQTMPDFNGPNLWSAQFAVADGSVLNLDVGWFLPKFPPSFVQIAGPHGFLRIRLIDGQGILELAGESRQVQAPSMRQNWAVQLDVFAAAIERGRAAIATVENGLAALRATKACEQSQRERRTVSIES